MKILIFFMVYLIFFGETSAQNDHKTQILSFQNQLNEHYSDTANSPLTEEDLQIFKGLDFFSINEEFKVEAKFTKVFNPVTVILETTTDRAPKYKIYAKVEFNLKGKTYMLNVYQNENLSEKNEYKDYLFLPFTDETNGITSYTGGRYVDLLIPEGETIIIDFNKAYNPYCAYNHKYSCVVPPKENHIDTEIMAGVKYVKKH